jgi:hypothetical protein
MKISDLPFPRLELRWKKVKGEKPYPEATYSYDNLCEYMLVISGPDKLDIRSNIIHEYHEEYGVKNIETIIGTTKSSGRIINDDGSIHTPLRDGVHIIRDAIEHNPSISMNDG